MTDRVMTAQEVAQKIHWHVNTVYRCRSLPRIRIGGSVRYLESQIDTWLAMSAERKAAPQSNPVAIMRHRLKVVDNG